MEIFSLVGILPQGFLNWYVRIENPRTALEIVKYISGFVLGTSLLSTYIYIGFYREKKLTKLNQSLLLFPSALTITSLRWLPLIGIDTYSKLSTVITSAIYALPFLIFVYLVEYKFNKRQTDLSNIPSSQMTLKEVNYKIWLEDSKYLLLENKYLEFFKRHLRVYLSKKDAINWVKRTPDILAARTVYSLRRDLFSYLYLSIIFGGATYIIEIFVLRKVSQIIKPLIVVYAIAFLICMALWPKIVSQIEITYKDIELTDEELNPK